MTYDQGVEKRELSQDLIDLPASRPKLSL